MTTMKFQVTQIKMNVHNQTIGNYLLFIIHPSSPSDLKKDVIVS